MSDTIEVCPWTISVSRQMTSGMVQDEEPFVQVNVCNQERGKAFTCRSAPDRVATLAEPIMAHVAMVERAAKVYCYAAWDKSADELKAAMVERGATFAPGYCVDVPVVIKR